MYIIWVKFIRNVTTVGFFLASGCIVFTVGTDGGCLTKNYVLLLSGSRSHLMIGINSSFSVKTLLNIFLTSYTSVYFYQYCLDSTQQSILNDYQNLVHVLFQLDATDINGNPRDIDQNKDGYNNVSQKHMPQFRLFQFYFLTGNWFFSSENDQLY